MLARLRQWRDQGSSRLDRDLDSRIDAAEAAIMDAAWSGITTAVLGPVLGPQLGDLSSLLAPDNGANSRGSSYGDGWYGYVDKDLRTLVGRPVDGAFKTRFSGARATWPRAERRSGRR